jgi:hypothetical protein
METSSRSCIYLQIGINANKETTLHFLEGNM